MKYDRPINAGKPWSAMDDFDLVSTLNVGFSLEKIAEFLEREVDECRLRAKQKGAASP